MAGKQAKILSTEQVDWLLAFAATTRNSLRNRVLILLSIKAGLRAGEIANLTWPMVLAPDGGVGSAIELQDCAAGCHASRAKLISSHATGLKQIVLAIVSFVGSQKVNTP